nr:transcription elongation factor B polypeptide 3-like [Cherax quadricarinatus]
MSNVAEQIAQYQRKLEKYAKTKEADKLLYYIHKLKYLNVTVSHLEETGVGRSVNSLRHHEGLVGEKARALVNKWKVMVKAEEEEEDDEEEIIDDEEEREQASVEAPDGGNGAREIDKENDNIDEDDEEEDRLQIEDEAHKTLEFEDEADGDVYRHPDRSSERNSDGGYTNCEVDSNDEGSVEFPAKYNPKTSQRDYQMHMCTSVPAEYVPSSSSLGSPKAVSGSVWKETSPCESSDRKNGSRNKSSSKKSSRDDKERYKEKERHKDREKDKHKDSSGSHDGRKKEHKEKHKDKHRDREERKGEKEKVKSHKEKHRDKDRHSEKHRVGKQSDEEYRVRSNAEVEEKGIINGFSTPEVERRAVDTKRDSRECDKRNDEKRKDKNEKGNSSHRKEESSGRDKDIIRENKISESSRERESSREKDSCKIKEKQKEEKYRDKHKDSASSSSSSKKIKHRKELDMRKNHEEPEDSEGDRKDSKKKKKKNEVDEDAGFGAALMGLDSPVKRKKKKKKKDTEKEKESSDEGSACQTTLEFTGGIPFEILRPVLERASPHQLLSLEDFNNYLLDDTNVLWEVHCKRDFRNKKLEEMETWREMWIRCYEERERKLKNLTQNLQQKFVSKAEPKRTTKLAFVDTAVKVPKSVARAQAKCGSSKPSATTGKPGKANEAKYGTAVPSATAAKPGKANEVAARKTAMQNAQRVERAANNPRPVSAKNKKVAPLMAKTRQFFKKAFRR